MLRQKLCAQTDQLNYLKLRNEISGSRGGKLEDLTSIFARRCWYIFLVVVSFCKRRKKKQFVLLIWHLFFVFVLFWKFDFRVAIFCLLLLFSCKQLKRIFRERTTETTTSHIIILYYIIYILYIYVVLYKQISLSIKIFFL